MEPKTLAAIHAVRERRMRQAVQALEAALEEGHAVSQALLRVSGLLERGIDPRRIRCTAGDLPRLLSLARDVEARQVADQGADARRPSRRIPV